MAPVGMEHPVVRIVTIIAAVIGGNEAFHDITIHDGHLDSSLVNIALVGSLGSRQSELGCYYAALELFPPEQKHPLA